jgi:hypothetical protein
VDCHRVLHGEADLQRRPTSQMVADAVELVRRFHPDGFAVEVSQYQELLCVEFQRASGEQGTHLPLYRINNSVNKQVQIRRLGPNLGQWRLRFKTRSPGTALLVQQLRDFPQAEHNDGPNSLEMAIRLGIELGNGRRSEGDTSKIGLSVGPT